MNYRIEVKFFGDLSTNEIYNILKLRNEVFVIEQNCIYQDADNKDLFCNHLMIFVNDELAAYARLVPGRLTYNEASIGRVVVKSNYRRLGLGKVLMKSAIDQVEEIWGITNIRISAQYHLQKFYNNWGFISENGVYDEDGIPHIEMLRRSY